MYLNTISLKMSQTTSVFSEDFILKGKKRIYVPRKKELSRSQINKLETGDRQLH